MTMTRKSERTDTAEEFGPGVAALLKCVNYLFIAGFFTVVVCVLWVLSAGGYYTVQPNETVIQLRFGRVIARYDDGAHWFFAPTDELVRIPTNLRQLSVTTFSSAEGTPESISKGLLPGVDGYLLTGDENIIQNSWKIEYRIARPMKYYRNTLVPADLSREDEELFDRKNNRSVGPRGPRTVIRNILENVLVEETAYQNVQDTLYTTRDYVARVKKSFVSALSELKYDIGVEIENVILISRTPPKETKQAFEDVLNAAQERSSELNSALAYRVKQENAALSEASEIKSAAESAKVRMVSEARSQSIYFNSIYEEYKKHPETILISLYNQAVEDAVSGTEQSFILRDNPHQELRLILNKIQKLKKNSNAAGDKK